MNDEIIDEVRAIREAHAAKFNFDLDAIYQDIKCSEIEHTTRGAKFIDRLPVTYGSPRSAYHRIRFGHGPIKAACRAD